MSTKVASTTFNSDGKEIIPTIDVYDKEPVNVPINKVVTTVEDSVARAQNNLADTATNLATDTVQQARDSITQAISPQGIIDIALGKKTFNKETILGGLPKNKDAAMDLVKDAIGAPLGQIKDLEKLKGDLVTDLLKSVGFADQSKALSDGILGVPGAQDPVSQLIDSNPKLKIIHDTEKFIRNDADLSSAQGIIDTVNTITGNSELAQVINTQAQFAVLGKLAMQASSLSLPYVIDSILTKVDVEDKPGFLLKYADEAIKKGDIAYIAKLTQYASAEQIAAASPDPAATFLSRYRIPKGEFTMVDLANALVFVLNGLQPGWDSYNRHGNLIGDLTAFRKASKDAKAVLVHSNTHRVPAMIVEGLSVLKLKPLIKRDFPYAAVI